MEIVLLTDIKTQFQLEKQKHCKLNANKGKKTGENCNYQSQS